MQNEEFMKLMRENVRIYDLTMPLSIHTPPWPSYMPLQIQYFKRIAGCFGGGPGANGQVIKMSNHVGTHMDGEIHFCASGRPIGMVPIQEWVGDGVVVDISDEVGDYELYSPEMLMSKADIRKGDILIINTGYHRYDWSHPGADEVRYFVCHPGPNADFAKWCQEMEFKWIGVDCGSADHPFNTIIRQWQPEHFARAEEKLKAKYGKAWDEMFPKSEYYQVMHLDLFPKHIVHAECLGGEIDELSNKRCWIGAFPWRGIEMESCGCRIIAFESK
ncbi:MAG: cyclase family protein [Myxococcota bacterium]|nr:cyclase family protein [Myxococcota bacterium]